jgi:sRNA-binding regulator protein Hfq
MPKSKAPAQTFEEPRYLTQLVESRQSVRVHLKSGESYEGTIEYWDADFVRLTRTDGPNLFLYKHDLRYIVEV